MAELCWGLIDKILLIRNVMTKCGFIGRVCKFCDMLNRWVAWRGIVFVQNWRFWDKWRFGGMQNALKNVQIYLFYRFEVAFSLYYVKWLNKICYLCNAFREIYITAYLQKQKAILYTYQDITKLFYLILNYEVKIDYYSCGIIDLVGIVF